MREDTAEQLVALESIDVVRAWHQRITARELNLRRANEIASSARQAREYLRNAANAAYSVRPLLTYYANASLSRAVVLLLRRNGGEETLARGHGLETVNWAEGLRADVGRALAALATLRVRSRPGLFRDLIGETQNISRMHVRSSDVDWTLPYPLPPEVFELAFADIASRLPDLTPPPHAAVMNVQFARVNQMTFAQEPGFAAQVQAEAFRPFQDGYVGSGYEVRENRGAYLDLRCPAATFENALPQLTHSYVRKLFGSIPELHLCPPFSDGVRLSQIALTFILSFFLGMLTRYFPTHWIAVQSGAKGDAVWPTLFSAQRYVESAYPELLLEFINYKVAHGDDA